jgi:hypothetical protein
MKDDYKEIDDMTVEEIEFMIWEQTPWKDRVQQNVDLGFRLVEEEIQRLQLDDTQSICDLAILPIQESHDIGWKLLEDILVHFCHDWSGEQVKEVVSPVKDRQEAEWAKEDVLRKIDFMEATI